MRREIHPLAELIPPMSAAAFAELKASIKANGLREPITLHQDGRVLDGRHRYRACTELGIIPGTETFVGTERECLDFVLDENVNRRHLDESQRAMIAARLAAWRLGQNQHTGGSANLPTQSDAARTLNVSPRSVRSAVEVHRSAIPEIVIAVEQGIVPVSKAALVARLPEERQQAVASQLGNGKSVATIVLAATRMERAAVIELAASNCPLSALGRTYPVIYADPPWHFELYSEGGGGKTADMNYPTMLTPDICALPVADITAKDAVLFMWAVSAMMPEALDVVRAWGFEFKTFAVWVKPNISCGHWFRGQHEPLIVATRGDMPPPPSLRSSVFEGGTSGRHSEKPAVVRDWIAAAYPTAGKIELFARSASPGWFAWGNQAPSIAA